MKNIAKILIPLAALVLAALLPFPYMFQGPLLDRMGKVVRIEVDPRFAGGDVQSRFLDPMDDDHGEGGLLYPDLPAFQGRRVLDIVRYSVHRPVLNTAAGDAPDFWQLDVTFAEVADPLKAPLGFSLPVIHIYIDLDGKEGGSTRTAEADAERVAFDPGHPWDYLIHVDGFAGDRKGYIVSFDRAYRRPVEVFFVEKTKTVHLRVGLDDPGIKRILDGRPTYHYVVVGAFDPHEAGGFMEGAVDTSARPALAPRVFDWVAPVGSDQERILSSYNPASGSLATLVPLEAREGPGRADSAAAADRGEAAALLATYRQKIAREAADTPPEDFASGIERLEKQGEGGMPLVEGYYRARMFEKAEEASRRILNSSPGHAGAATYLAMAIAGQSGRQSSPLKSLELVNSAIGQFARALPLCRTPDERLLFHLQRGRYFAAIPESLFRMSATAADDFLKAAAIIKKQEPGGERAFLLTDCYINAARALLKAGNADEAEIYFHKAAAARDLNSVQIVALLEQGIIPAVLRR